jgi:hypothetical protein
MSLFLENKEVLTNSSQLKSEVASTFRHMAKEKSSVI